MRWWTKAHWTKVWIGFVLCGTAIAGPVEFGMAELNAAIDARNFKYRPKIMAELNLEAPGTFRIDPYAAGGGHITGGDLRGLMYGLLEAADQMRSTGRLKLTHGVPALALRGVRIAADPQAEWFLSGAFWQSYFTAMAHSRFNRLELAFASVPPTEMYPPLRSITEIAQQFGVDVAIGFGAPQIQAIEDLLKNCPVVKSIVLHGEVFPDADALLRTLRDSGRRVVLELPDIEPAFDLIEAAGKSGAPLRLFAPYTGAGGNPQPRDSYWEMDATQGADAVNAISGAGFEVRAEDPPSPDAPPNLDSIAAWGRLGYTRPAK